MALNFTFAGCNLPGRNGGCTQPTYARAATDPYTCVVSLAVPRGSALLDSAQLALTIPSYVSFQALALSFAQTAAPIDLEAWAKAHPSDDAQDAGTEEAEYTQNSANISAVLFSETLLFPATNSSASAEGLGAGEDEQQYLQSTIGREWVLTPVAFRSQRPGQWGDVFDSQWYTQVVSTLPPTLPVQPLHDFLYNDQAQGITIQINFQTNLYFTQLLSQRLVGENEVILTILLSIIGQPIPARSPLCAPLCAPLGCRSPSHVLCRSLHTAIFHVTEMAEKIVVISLSFFVPLCKKCYDDYLDRDAGGSGAAAGAVHGSEPHAAAGTDYVPLHGGGGSHSAPHSHIAGTASGGGLTAPSTPAPASPAPRSQHELADVSTDNKRQLQFESGSSNTRLTTSEPPNAATHK
jgi:hypothetical protein